tara:strand:+ start:7202 stop:7444 length:243 start_codon:yes stop_codon:yes gene_type:complete
MRFSLLIVSLLFLSGCAFWEGFERVVTGNDPEVLESIGETTGSVVVDSVNFLPSPWREIVVGLISGLTGWTAAKKNEEDK